MEDRAQILKKVFGSSSSSSSSSSSDGEDEILSSIAVEKSPKWERVNEIDGLWICTDILSPERQYRLLSAIEREGWFTGASHNQAMRFGDLPEWANELSTFIREAICCSEIFPDLCETSTTHYQSNKQTCPLASGLLWREPLFDQLIVNVYLPGEGICAHVDLMRFDDGIAIVSLESACVMHFTRAKAEACCCENEDDKEENHQVMKIPVFLPPGSLVLMSGEARYLWKHEINRKPDFQVWEGQQICQKKRTSVTLRKLLQPN